MTKVANSMRMSPFEKIKTFTESSAFNECSENFTIAADSLIIIIRPMSNCIKGTLLSVNFLLVMGKKICLICFAIFSGAKSVEFRSLADKLRSE